MGDEPKNVGTRLKLLLQLGVFKNFLKFFLLKLRNF